MDSYVDDILGELDPSRPHEKAIMYTQREVGIIEDMISRLYAVKSVSTPSQSGNAGLGSWPAQSTISVGHKFMI